MSTDILAVMALVLAALPAGLFVLNLLIYRPLPPGRRRKGTHSEAPPEKLALPGFGPQGISVLIPARDEEQNIRAALEAVLANHDCDFEVIVLDDHSTDRTAAVVNEFAARDSRVRLENAPHCQPAGAANNMPATFWPNSPATRCWSLLMPMCGSRRMRWRGWHRSWPEPVPPSPVASHVRNSARLASVC